MPENNKFTSFVDIITTDIIHNDKIVITKIIIIDEDNNNIRSKGKTNKFNCTNNHRNIIHTFRKLVGEDRERKLK